ncbi:MAG: hypothetical protein RL030_2727 [Pseudomonadota bacterium]|jgi:hypothetical protein
MAPSRSDLLSVTRTLVVAARIFSIAIAVLLGIILVALLIKDTGTLTVLGSSTLPPEQRLFAARVGVAAGLVNCLLFAPLLTHLLRFIDSARKGDPFVPENGRRLRRIGWLLLEINIVVNVAISVALTRAVKFPPVSFTAVVTVLMIFVIARIFDTGTAMRAELQETI